jgi:hypothetical protein
MEWYRAVGGPFCVKKLDYAVQPQMDADKRRWDGFFEQKEVNASIFANPPAPRLRSDRGYDGQEDAKF